MKKTNVSIGPWTENEVEQFFEGYKALGRRWKKITENFVKTRNFVQVTSFAQKCSKENKF